MGAVTGAPADAAGFPGWPVAQLAGPRTPAPSSDGRRGGIGRRDLFSRRATIARSVGKLQCRRVVNRAIIGVAAALPGLPFFPLRSQPAFQCEDSSDERGRFALVRVAARVGGLRVEVLVAQLAGFELAHTPLV